MQVTSVTQGEIEQARNAAQKIATDLNKLLEENSLRELLRTKKIAFVYHPMVISGQMGRAYKEGTIAWVNGGALEQLMKMLDKDVPGEKPKFCGGTLGSVWFDTELTGGEGKARRTKLVRVTPMHQDGTYNIMLDNTFDEVW